MSFDGPVTVETHGDTVVVDLTAWDGDPEKVANAEETFLEFVDGRGFTGAVTDLGETSLGPETQSHVAQSWSEIVERTSIERFAYVSEGIEAMAVTANIEAAAETETFDSREAALSWAEGRRPTGH